jgi:class 3 adenylate cyclase/tetratricopeptide (TPR) repeat protein
MEPALRAYIPRGIQASLTAGQGDWLGELRRITVMFIHLPELDDPETSLERAQLAVHTIQSILYRYEGNLNKLSVDEKGITLVAALGLPPLAHEDDAVRGVQVALTVQKSLHDHGMHCTIGVATGQVFCGAVGNEQRREYTILGQVVNLAAHLMHAARAGIVCDTTTHELTRSRITFEALPPLQLKKKRDEKVSTFRPVAMLTATPAPTGEQTTILGRNRERMFLAAQLQYFSGRQQQQTEEQPALSADVPPRSLILLEGEPGIGKSCLLDDTLQQAVKLGLHTVAVAGSPMNEGIAYFPWREILQAFLGLEAATPLETQRQQVLSHFADAPDMMPLIPLLDAVLPLDFAADMQTMSLTGQARAAATRSLLLHLLNSATRHTPTLLLLDNAHWFDPASWLALEEASQHVPNLRIVLALRPLKGTAPDYYARVSRASQAHVMRLKVFSLSETTELIRQRLGVDTVPNALVQLIHGQARGNTFFSEQLLYVLRDAGLITVRERVCTIASEGELVRYLRQSDTVQTVITARLDKISPSQQIILKVASVIGKEFSLHMLADIHPLHPTPHQLAADLVALQRLSLIHRNGLSVEPVYRFEHAITQEVIYNLMAFSQRRQLHSAIVAWYERTNPEHPDTYAPLLAQHLLRADDDRALAALIDAGDMALRNHTYPEALGLYNQALDVAHQHLAAERPISDMPRLLRRLFQQRGRAFELNASGEQALANYLAMEAIATQRDDPQMELAALMARATLCAVPALMYDPAQAQATLEQALPLARQINDYEAEARIFWNLMLLHMSSSGIPQQALEYGEQALVLARTHHLHEQLAFTLNDISMAYRVNGSLPRSLDALEEARLLWEKLANQPMQADNFARLSVVHFLASNYDQAVYWTQRACQLNETIRNAAGGVGSRLVVGNVYLHRGQFDTAIREMEAALALAEQSNNLAVQVGTGADLGWVYGSLGMREHGLHLARQAYVTAESRIPHLLPWAQAVLVRLYIRHGNLAAAASTLTFDYQEVLHGPNTVLAPMLAALASGELALARRDYPQAATIAEDLLSYLDTSGVQAFRVEGVWLKGQALAGAQRGAAALEVLEEARALADQLQARHLEWQILAELSHLHIQQGQQQSAEACWQRAHTLLEDLITEMDSSTVCAAFLALPLVVRVQQGFQRSFPVNSSAGQAAPPVSSLPNHLGA